MDRRAAGFILLAVVLMATVVMSSLVGPGRSGRAQVGTLPPPPSPGNCLNVLQHSAELVDCAAPHTGEVVVAWAAWDQMTAGLDNRSLRAACWADGRDYLTPIGLARGDPLERPLPSSAWSSVPLVVGTDLVVGPGLASDPLGWRACIAVPQNTLGPLTRTGQWSGRLADLQPMDRRPSALRSCYSGGGPFPPAAPCGRPHRGEVVATRTVAAGTDLRRFVDDPLQQSECAQRASAAVGVPDPTFGGRLQLGLDVRLVQASARIGGSDAETDAAGQGDTAVARCVLEAVRGSLTSSVIGLGTAPLPVS